MRAGIAAELYKFENNIDQLLAEFKAIAIVRPDVEYLTTYLKYLNERTDVNKLTRFYIALANGIYQSNSNTTWAVHYLQMAYEINPSDPQINSLLAHGYRLINRPDLAQKHSR